MMVFRRDGSEGILTQGGMLPDYPPVRPGDNENMNFCERR